MEPQDGQAVQPVTESGTEIVNPDPSYSWQASEYIFHEKPVWWYGVFWLVVAAICGGLVLLHQWLSIAVAVAMALAVVVYTRKEPRVLNYSLDEKGVSIDGKATAFTSYRSFSVIEDTAWHAVDLEPSQRFVPRLTLLCESDDVDTIVAILSQHLPRADRHPDWIERASRYLRF